MQNIVLNIPHSSNSGVFDNRFGKWNRNASFVNNCLNRWTDWYTDYLFNIDDERVKSVVFPYSRFVCDVERLENDKLEEIGQGIIYSKFEEYTRGKLSDDAVKYLLSMRKKHLDELAGHLTNNSLLIDCHSFPRDVYNTDICIGYNNDWSYDKGITDLIINEFTKSGYSVEINKPYSNSIIPDTGFEYKSILIEVNKRVYMNEEILTLNPNPRQFMRWFGCIERIYNHVLS